MKKILLLLLTLMLCVSCASNSTVQTEDTNVEEEVTDSVDIEEEVLNVLAPAGATAVPFAQMILDGSAFVEVVDGADALQAAFVNPEPMYDVIVAPTNLGVKLASLGKTEYKLAYVLTWGNLYLVSEKESLDECESIAAFGEAAVPGLVYNTVYADYADITTFYNSVADAQAALLTGEADAALIAEPAATATIAKGKDQDKEFKIIENVQDKWASVYGGLYPQAGIFFLESKYNEYDPSGNAMELFIGELAEFTESVNNGSTDIAALIDEVGADLLGVPNGTIVGKVWPRLNISVTSAAASETQVHDFLSVFGVENSSDGILK